MTFLNPSALWGLLALAVPVLVHLFHFRRYTTVYFSDVRLLSQMEEQRSTRSNLKRWLLLFTRLLVIFFTVMAFAQPTFEKDSVTASSDAIERELIVLDNSMSMYEGDDPSFSRAQRELAQYLSSAPGEKKYQVIGHGDFFDPKLWYGADSALEMISSMNARPYAKPLGDILMEVKSNKDSLPLNIKVFTDGQRNFISTSDKSDSMHVDLHLHEPLYNTQDVSTIDSLWWIERPSADNQLASLAFQLDVHQPENVTEVRLKYGALTLDSMIVAPNVSGLYRDTLQFQLMDTGWINLSFELGLDPKKYNNDIPIGVYRPETINVLIVSELSATVGGRALAGTSGFEVNQISLNTLDEISLSEDTDYEVIILEACESLTQGQIEYLSKMRDASARMIILPPVEFDVSSYDNAFRQWDIPLEEPYAYRGKINSLNSNHYLLNGMLRGEAVRSRFPEVYRGMTWKSNDIRRTTPIYSTLNGDVLLYACTGWGGPSYVFTASTEKEASSLLEDPLFAPLLYKMAMTDASSFPAYVRLGPGAKYTLPNTRKKAESPIEFKTLTESWIPKQSVSSEGVVCAMNRVPLGHLTGYQGSSKRFSLGCALSLDEANAAFWKAEDLRSQEVMSNVVLYSSDELIDVKPSGIFSSWQIWKILLCITLLALLSETLIIRLFSKT